MMTREETTRRARSLAPLLAATLFATACSSTGSKSKEVKAPASRGEQVEVSVTGAEATQEGDTIRLEYPEPEELYDRIPDWVINPAMGGVVGAVGVASRNELGMQEQLDEARLNGRLELVNMLEARVQRVGRSETEEDVRAEVGDKATRARKDILEVDRNILDGVLAGTRQRALWIDHKSGEAYVWMVVDGAILDSVDHSVAKDVSVFVASQKVASEFKPDRPKRQPPQVIVTRTKPEPLPEEPKTPVDELEGRLKPIETIPTESSSGNEGRG